MEFVIPASKDDLLNRKDARHYVVEDVLTPRQIPPALAAFRAVCKTKPMAVSEHFDTYFSILCVQKELDNDIKERAWFDLISGCQSFWHKLSSVLDEPDLSREVRLSNLNCLKMSCYLLCQFMELFESLDTKPTTVTVKDKKGKGKKNPKAGSLTLDWSSEKVTGLGLLYDFINLTLLKLWNPPVVEEEFVSMVSSCSCKLLENPSIAKSKELIALVAHILGNLVQRYNHGLSMSLKIDQLLKHFEFLAYPMAQMVEIMVNDHRCKSTVADLFREIGNCDNNDASKDTTAAKSYAVFMVELAERVPSVVLPYVSLVIGLLDKEPYTLRNGVLGMLGEILIKYLSKDNMDSQRTSRDSFFDKLKAHICDVNAFVRSKVLQIWQKIITEGCLPLLRQESLMAAAVDRLHDKSSIVRRHALQLVTTLLISNPFASKLSVEDLKVNYEKESATLNHMTPETLTPGAPSSVDEKVDQEWKDIHSKLTAVVGQEEFLEKCKDASNLIADGESSDNVLAAIVAHLDSNELAEALMLTCAAMESYPDIPVFCVQNAVQEPMDEEDVALSDADKLISAVKEVYFWVKCPMISHSHDTSDDQLNADLVKQKTLVQYLKNSMVFAMQVQQCIPIICQLLGSKNTTDVLEAIQFFVTAADFGVSAATVGVSKMLVLIWSQEKAVREAVVDAYKKLYLSPSDRNQKNPAKAVVKNLSALLLGITFGDLMSLEALIAELVKSGDIGTPVIKVLWNSFTLKPDTVTPQDARCAIQLIAMCAEAEPQIVKSNIDLLVEEGLGPRGETDYLLAQGVCQALLKLVPASKEKGKLPSEPFRLEASHNMFERLKTILIKRVTDTTLNYWIPLAEQAIAVIYKLCDKPDTVTSDLLKQLMAVLKQTCNEEMLLHKDGGDVPDDTVSSTLVSCVMARVFSAAGQVAFRQTVFMEVDVLAEMKRLQTAREENRKGRRKSRGGDNSKATDLEEDMALAGASAEDTEAEYIRQILDCELLSETNLLIKFVPLILDVCNNSAKFPDPILQKEASLALARYCIINPQFCDHHLQLLFTLLEKSSSPIIRSNLIIALGDLTFRFPNLIEPWTSHLYSRLRDPTSDVRKTTLHVLTHLILNDMVKVKGQISELAVCIVDPDKSISGLAKLFFHELAKKSNSMYNMPDIISRLSDPDIGIDQDNFQLIIKYIFSHIEKSKHCESLVEKLCHRFRGTRTDRQVQDLSFCLSQLSYSDKATAKLMDNFACFADKLVDPVVYGHFMQIISKSRQFIRPEAKTNLEEWENKIVAAHTRGLDGSEENQTAATKTSVCVKGKGTKAKPKGRGKARSMKENIEENEDDEDEEIESSSPLKPRRVRGGKKASKPRYTIDSDDDCDEFFDIGKEGQKERALDDDDSFVTKLSQRRTKKGKVPLTPLSPSFSS